MVKIRATVAYDGTEFHGFARQTRLRTVQGVLEEKLSALVGQPTEVFGSGRTDAGVHARAQVVHWEQTAGPPPERYPLIFRGSLPRDVVMVDAKAVSAEFHARFSAVGKTYRYTIQTAPQPDVFTRRYAWQMSAPLDRVAMEQAAAHLTGEHDFTSFCAAATPVVNKVRTVSGITLHQDGSYLHLYVTGSGFLQHMVRIVTGTLVDVGLGKLDTVAIPEILTGRDRRLAGKTAPPEGLCLWEVVYDEDALDQPHSVR